jgi:hypothetical protein
MPLDAAEKALILARLERMHTLLDRLDKVSIDLVERKQLRARMRRELSAAKKAVKTFATHDRPDDSKSGARG